MLKRYQSAVVLASEFLSCHFIHILSSWGDTKAFPRAVSKFTYAGIIIFNSFLFNYVISVSVI